MAESATDLQKKPLKAGERVILTRDIRGAAEGAAGRIKMAAGLTWPRYWVEFDNGRWIGSISQAHLVKAKDWETFRKLREEELRRPKVVETVSDETAASPEGGGDAGGATSRVPAHLLERSRKARERLASAG